MSLRLYVLASSFIAFLLVLLSNIESVPIRFFFINITVPLSYVIAAATLFGAGITAVFYSLGEYEKKLKKRDKRPK